MFNHLVPLWLSPFCYWVVITIFYLASNKWVSDELKGYEYPINFLKSIYYILSVLFLSVVITFVLHGMFMYRVDIDEEDYKVLERFKWKDLFTIVAIPALIGVFVAIIKHNKILYNLYSKDFFKKEQQRKK